MLSVLAGPASMTRSLVLPSKAGSSCEASAATTSHRQYNIMILLWCMSKTGLQPKSCVADSTSVTVQTHHSATLASCFPILKLVIFKVDQKA